MYGFIGFLVWFNQTHPAQYLQMSLSVCALSPVPLPLYTRVSPLLSVRTSPARIEEFYVYKGKVYVVFFLALLLFTYVHFSLQHQHLYVSCMCVEAIPYQALCCNYTREGSTLFSLS